MGQTPVNIRKALEGIQRLDADTAPLMYDIEENLICEAKDNVHRLYAWAV